MKRCFNKNVLQELAKFKKNENNSEELLSQLVNEIYGMVYHRGVRYYINDYANIAIQQSLNICVFNACTQLSANDKNIILSKNNVSYKLEQTHCSFAVYTHYQVMHSVLCVIFCCFCIFFLFIFLIANFSQLFCFNF